MMIKEHYNAIKLKVKIEFINQENKDKELDDNIKLTTRLDDNIKLTTRISGISHSSRMN